MRFFSNEAKDNVDDETGERGSHPAEHPVPHQRAGSPWQHDTEPAAPQPTAAGASAAGDRFDDPSPAGDRFDDPDRTDRLPDTADRTVAFTDGVTRDRNDEAAWPASATNDLDRDRDADRAVDRDQDADRDRPTVAAQGRTDAYRDDKEPVVEDGGTFDDPHLTQPIPAHAGATDTAARTDVTDADDKADHDRADHVTAADKADHHKADHVTAADKADHVTAADKADDAQEKAEAAEVAAVEAKEQAGTPANTITGASSFFPAADTQPLRDRWRDVQLRFVDDPKGATADAAGLVDEAVDKLVQGLRDQRGALAKGTDDTESLRVELRSYRDILDRLLGL